MTIFSDNVKTSQPYKSKIMIILVLNSILLNGPNVVTAKHEDLKQPRIPSLLKTTDFFGRVGTTVAQKGSQKVFHLAAETRTPSEWLHKWVQEEDWPLRGCQTRPQHNPGPALKKPLILTSQSTFNRWRPRDTSQPCPYLELRKCESLLGINPRQQGFQGVSNSFFFSKGKMTLCSGPELKWCFSEMQTGIAGALGTQCWDAKPRPLRNSCTFSTRGCISTLAEARGSAISKLPFTHLWTVSAEHTCACNRAATAALAVTVTMGRCSLVMKCFPFSVFLLFQLKKKNRIWTLFFPFKSGESM